jgi:hypothetical protein
VDAAFAAGDADAPELAAAGAAADDGCPDEEAAADAVDGGLADPAAGAAGGCTLPVTTTVPFMFGWTAQLYAYVPEYRKR